ncbi:TetR/AcrR family transcriptional regulator [Faecalispora anaeroviscerum]|uniref:TetR/AcrR family transcriptional regulator n=1 Tax=Faecalispora anaeroviscerum TaxID=2991836 RepID=UPI0024BA0763|nr:TetR/AcrR family transcriptional regulator [Faecalispora anaeroviscerum]
MEGKLLNKKKQKYSRLYDAAYDLFLSKGVHNTIIDDIVKDAGVAKGTFYLYFRDKYDLADQIIIRKTSVLLNQALDALEEKKKSEPQNFQQCVIFIADYLMCYFAQNKKFLEFTYKNLSLNLYEKIMNCTEMSTARQMFIRDFIAAGEKEETAHMRLYILISLVSSVCYNSVILGIPFQFEMLKTELHHSIEKILT